MKNVIRAALEEKGYRVVPGFDITKYEKKQIFDTKLQGRQNMCYKNRQYWRDIITENLEKEGFEEGGMYSTSAVFRWYENSKGWKLNWGMRYNISGKRQKYFTLFRYFESSEEIVRFLNSFLDKHLINKEEFDKIYDCGLAENEVANQ